MLIAKKSLLRILMLFPAPTATGVHRLKNTWSPLWEVIYHKKVQQHFLNQSLEHPPPPPPPPPHLNRASIRYYSVGTMEFLKVLWRSSLRSLRNFRSLIKNLLQLQFRNSASRQNNRLRFGINDGFVLTTINCYLHSILSTIFSAANLAL